MRPPAFSVLSLGRPQHRTSLAVVTQSRQVKSVPVANGGARSISQNRVAVQQDLKVIPDFSPGERRELAEHRGEVARLRTRLKNAKDFPPHGVVEGILKLRLQRDSEIVGQPSIHACPYSTQSPLLCWLMESPRSIKDRCASVEAASRSYEGNFGQ